MPADAAARALAEVRSREAWAVIRLRDSATVTLVGGSRSEVERVLDVPLEEGAPPPGRRFDRLLAVPFRQVAERGFAAHDDGAPLVVVDIDTETEVAFDELVAALPDVPLEFADTGGFEQRRGRTPTWSRRSSVTRSATARARTS